VIVSAGGKTQSFEDAAGSVYVPWVTGQFSAAWQAWRGRPVPITILFMPELPDFAAPQHAGP
jgi:hypothetical protein